MWLFIKCHFNKCRTLHGTEMALGEQQRSHNQHVGARLSSCSYRRRRANTALRESRAKMQRFCLPQTYLR